MGPPLASGWNWAVNIGFVLCIIPWRRYRVDKKWLFCISFLKWLRNNGMCFWYIPLCGKLDPRGTLNGRKLLVLLFLANTATYQSATFSHRRLYKTASSTSLVSSLALTKSGLHPGGSEWLSMPNPWFCAVMKAWPVIMFSTGWFWPLENRERKKKKPFQFSS